MDILQLPAIIQGQQKRVKVTDKKTNTPKIPCMILTPATDANPNPIQHKNNCPLRSPQSRHVRKHIGHHLLIFFFNWQFYNRGPFFSATIDQICPLFTTYLPPVDIGERNIFTFIKTNLRSVDIPSAIYLPRLVNIVKERPLTNIIVSPKCTLYLHISNKDNSK